MSRDKPRWYRQLCKVLAAAIAASGAHISPAVWAASPASGFPPAINLARLDLSRFTVPRETGDLVEAWQPEGRAPSGLVLHIQDVHGSPEVAEHTAALLARWHDELGVSLIAHEGASGFFNFEPYWSLPEPETTELASLAFLRLGVFTGAEHFAITHPDGAVMWGAEDDALYRAHLEAYRQGRKSQGATLAVLARLEQALIARRGSIYPKPLLRLMELRHGYETHAEEGRYRSYLAELYGLAARARVATDRYPHLAALREAEAIYATLDMASVRREHERVREDLRRRASVEQRRALDHLTADFEVGKVDAAFYYEMVLRAAAGRRNTAEAPLREPPASLFAQFRERAGAWWIARAAPALSRYVRYLATVKRISAARLSQELNALHEAVESVHLETAEQRAAFTALERVQQLARLASTSMTPPEYRRFRAERNGYARDPLVRLLSEALPAGVPASAEEMDSLAAQLPVYESFYDLALRRDEALFRHTAQQLARRVTPALALVTGGFHTPGLTERLRSANIAYAVIAPRVTKPVDPRIYQRNMDGEPPTLEELYASLPPDALSSPPATAPGSPLAARIIERFQALKARLTSRRARHTAAPGLTQPDSGAFLAAPEVRELLTLAVLDVIARVRAHTWTADAPLTGAWLQRSLREAIQYRVEPDAPVAASPEEPVGIAVLDYDAGMTQSLGQLLALPEAAAARGQGLSIPELVRGIVFDHHGVFYDPLARDRNATRALLSEIERVLADATEPEQAIRALERRFRYATTDNLGDGALGVWAARNVRLLAGSPELRRLVSHAAWVEDFGAFTGELSVLAAHSPAIADAVALDFAILEIYDGALHRYGLAGTDRFGDLASEQQRRLLDEVLTAISGVISDPEARRAQASRFLEAVSRAERGIPDVQSHLLEPARQVLLAEGLDPALLQHFFVVDLTHLEPDRTFANWVAAARANPHPIGVTFRDLPADAQGRPRTQVIVSVPFGRSAPPLQALGVVLNQANARKAVEQAQAHGMRVSVTPTNPSAVQIELIRRGRGDIGMMFGREEVQAAFPPGFVLTQTEIIVEIARFLASSAGPGDGSGPGAAKRNSDEFEEWIDAAGETIPGARATDEVRQTDTSWAIAHVPNAAARTWVSMQFEKGLDANVLKEVIRLLGERVESGAMTETEALRWLDQIPQDTMAGGLGALMPDIVPGMADNGVETVSISPLYHALRQEPRHAVLDLLRPALARAGYDTHIVPVRLANGETYTVTAWIGKTGQAMEIWLDAPEVFAWLYPDDDQARVRQMAVFNEAAQDLVRSLKAEGRLTGTGWALLENEVYVSLPKPRLEAEGAVVIAVNHSIVPNTIPSYHANLLTWLAGDRVAAYPEAVNADGKVQLTELHAQRVRATGGRILGVSSEHTGVLRDQIFPKHRDLLVYHDNTNGVYLDRWQAPTIQSLVARYREALIRAGSLVPEAEAAGFFAALEADGALHGAFLHEFDDVKRFEQAALINWLQARYGIDWRDDPLLPIGSDLRRVVPYKSLDVFVDRLLTDEGRREFMATGTRLLAGGRTFDPSYGYGPTQLSRLEALLHDHPELASRIALIPEYNIGMAEGHIFRAMNFTVMMADRYMEAAATSPQKGLVNGAVSLAVKNGAPLDWLQDWREPGHEREGNGLWIDYAGDRPDGRSLLRNLAVVGATWADPVQRRNAQYQALKTGMIHCDVTTRQTRGILRVTERALMGPPGLNRPAAVSIDGSWEASEQAEVGQTHVVTARLTPRGESHPENLAVQLWTHRLPLSGDRDWGRPQPLPMRFVRREADGTLVFEGARRFEQPGEYEYTVRASGVSAELAEEGDWVYANGFGENRRVTVSSRPQEAARDFSSGRALTDQDLEAVVEAILASQGGLRHASPLGRDLQRRELWQPVRQALEESGYSLRTFPAWRMPPTLDAPTFSLGDVEAIAAHLTRHGHNWYWNLLNEPARAQVLLRAKRLAPAIELVRTQVTSQGFRILGIAVQGGYLWGPQSEDPPDVDILVITEGDTFRTLQLPADQQALFPEPGRTPRSVSVRVIGLEWLTGARRSGRAADKRVDHPLSLSLSWWGGGMVVDGTDVFDLPLESVPPRALLVKAGSFAANGLDHFGKQERLKALRRWIEASAALRLLERYPGVDPQVSRLVRAGQHPENPYSLTRIGDGLSEYLMNGYTTVFPSDQALLLCYEDAARAVGAFHRPVLLLALRRALAAWMAPGPGPGDGSGPGAAKRNSDEFDEFIDDAGVPIPRTAQAISVKTPSQARLLLTLAIWSALAASAVVIAWATGHPGNLDGMLGPLSFDPDQLMVMLGGGIAAGNPRTRKHTASNRTRRSPSVLSALAQRQLRSLSSLSETEFDTLAASLRGPALERALAATGAIATLPATTTFGVELEFHVSRVIGISSTDDDREPEFREGKQALIRWLRTHLPRGWRVEPGGLSDGILEVNSPIYRNTPASWSALERDMTALLNERTWPARAPGGTRAVPRFYSVHLHIGGRGFKKSEDVRRALLWVGRTFEALWRKWAAYDYSLLMRYGSLREFRSETTRTVGMLHELHVTSNHSVWQNVSTRFPTLEFKANRRLARRLRQGDPPSRAELIGKLYWAFALFRAVQQHPERFTLATLGLPVVIGERPSQRQIARFLDVVFGSEDLTGKAYGLWRLTQPDRPVHPSRYVSAEDRETRLMDIRTEYAQLGLEAVFDFHKTAVDGWHPELPRILRQRTDLIPLIASRIVYQAEERAAEARKLRGSRVEASALRRALRLSLAAFPTPLRSKLARHLGVLMLTALSVQMLTGGATTHAAVQAGIDLVTLGALILAGVSRDDGAPAASPGSAKEQKPGVAERPLAAIDPGAIRSIMVVLPALFLGMPKLGDEVIMGVPLIRGLLARFPHATIRVVAASDMPRIFDAPQFEGRVRQVPDEAAARMRVFQERTRSKAALAARAAALQEASVDLLIELRGEEASRFAWTPGMRKLTMPAPLIASLFSGDGDASLAREPAHYRDALGGSFLVPGIAQPAEEGALTIDRWESTYRAYEHLGLERSEMTSPFTPTEAEQAVGEQSLQAWLGDPPGGLRHPLVLVNVLGVADGDVLSHAEWIPIIMRLVQQHRGHVVLVHGGRNPEGKRFVEQIGEQVAQWLPEDQREKLLVPAAPLELRSNLHAVFSALEARRAALVTVNTGLLHVASLYGLPMAVITTDQLAPWVPTAPNIQVIPVPFVAGQRLSERAARIIPKVEAGIDRFLEDVASDQTDPITMGLDRMERLVAEVQEISPPENFRERLAYELRIWPIKHELYRAQLALLRHLRVMARVRYMLSGYDIYPAHVADEVWTVDKRLTEAEMTRMAALLPRAWNRDQSPQAPATRIAALHHEQQNVLGEEFLRAWLGAMRPGDTLMLKEALQYLLSYENSDTLSPEGVQRWVSWVLEFLPPGVTILVWEQPNPFGQFPGGLTGMLEASARIQRLEAEWFNEEQRRRWDALNEANASTSMFEVAEDARNSVVLVAGGRLSAFNTIAAASAGDRSVASASSESGTSRASEIGPLLPGSPYMYSGGPSWEQITAGLANLLARLRGRRSVSAERTASDMPLPIEFIRDGEIRARDREAIALALNEPGFLEHTYAETDRVRIDRSQVTAVKVSLHSDEGTRKLVYRVELETTQRTWYGRTLSAAERTVALKVVKRPDERAGHLEQHFFTDRHLELMRDDARQLWEHEPPLGPRPGVYTHVRLADGEEVAVMSDDFIPGPTNWQYRQLPTATMHIGIRRAVRTYVAAWLAWRREQYIMDPKQDNLVLQLNGNGDAYWRLIDLDNVGSAAAVKKALGIEDLPFSGFPSLIVDMLYQVQIIRRPPTQTIPSERALLFDGIRDALPATEWRPFLEAARDDYMKVLQVIRSRMASYERYQDETYDSDIPDYGPLRDRLIELVSEIELYLQEGYTSYQPDRFSRHPLQQLARRIWEVLRIAVAWARAT